MTVYLVYMYSHRDHQLHLLNRAGYVAEAQAEHILRRKVKQRYPHIKLTRKQDGRTGAISLNTLDGFEFGRIVAKHTGYSHTRLQAIIRQRVLQYRSTGQV